MSIPPDQFDENGNPIEPGKLGRFGSFDSEEFEPESFDEEFVAWRADSEPPWWFEENANLFWEMDHRASVFLSVLGGVGAAERDEFGNYSLIIRGYDEDTGEGIDQPIQNMSIQDLMDFYDYTINYYDDSSFWPDGGSGDLATLWGG